MGYFVNAETLKIHFVWTLFCLWVILSHYVVRLLGLSKKYSCARQWSENRRGHVCISINTRWNRYNFWCDFKKSTISIQLHVTTVKHHNSCRTHRRLQTRKKNTSHFCCKRIEGGFILQHQHQWLINLSKGLFDEWFFHIFLELRIELSDKNTECALRHIQELFFLLFFLKKKKKKLQWGIYCTANPVLYSCIIMQFSQSEYEFVI